MRSRHWGALIFALGALGAGGFARAQAVNKSDSPTTSPASPPPASADDPLAKAMAEAQEAFSPESASKPQGPSAVDNSATQVNGYVSNRFTFSWMNVSSLLPVSDTPGIANLLEVNLQLRRDLFTGAFAYVDASAVLQPSGYFVEKGPDGQRRMAKNRDVVAAHPAFIMSEVYLSYSPAPNVNLLLGKKRVVWGSGLTINPTDLLNPPKDPSDPNLQRAGAYLFRLEIPAEWMSFSALFAPQVLYQESGLPYQFLKYPEYPPRATVQDPKNNPDPRDAAFHYLTAARLYFLVKDSDINLMYFFSNKFNDDFSNKSRFGISFSRYFFTSYELHAEALLQQGSNRQFVRGECVQNGFSTIATCVAQQKALFGKFKLDDKTLNAKVLVGTRRAFSDESSLSVEYLYLSDGYTPTEFRDFTRGLSLAAQAPAALTSQTAAGAASGGLIPRFTFDPFRRHYLFINYSKPKIADDFTITAIALVGLEDLSGLVIPSVTWNIREWLNLNLTGFFPVRGIKVGQVEALGRQFSEYSMVPFDWRVLFEVRAFY